MSSDMSNLPDVPYAQLQYRNALLTTEFATDRRAKAARKGPRARWISRQRRNG